MGQQPDKQYDGPEKLELQAALAASKLGTWKLDLSTSTLTCSSACKANYGYEAADSFSYADLAASVDPADREPWRATVKRAIEERDGFDIEYRAHWPDGSIHWMLVRGMWLPSDNSDGVLMGISVDVSGQRRTRAAIEGAQQRLAATLATAEIGTWVWNIEDDTLIADANLRAMVGGALGEFSTPTLAAFLATIHADDRDKVARAFQGSLERRERMEIRYRVRGPDGTSRFLLARGFVEIDDVRPLRMSGVVIDVTGEVEALARMDASEARYQTLFATIQDGFCILELVPLAEGRSDLRYAELNDAFVMHSGLAHAEGRTVRELFPERGDEALAPYLAVLATREPVRFEVALDAGSRSLEVHAFPIPGAPDRVAVLFRDITERKRAETELHTSEVRLTAANRAKDDFLAMLGHELRNPLSPITTALELMEMRDAHAFPKERSIIRRQVQHLQRLVEDLLDIARFAQGKIELAHEAVNVTHLIANSVELAEPLIEQRRHHLRIEPADDALQVWGDATRLAQVLSNLLTNAAKYTDPGGTISIRTDSVDGHVRIAVKDNGIGISNEILPTVFDLFTQARQEIDRAKGGLGLGLAIVKTIVTLHRGTVVAESAGHGRGSTFTVTLPLAPAVTRAADISLATATSASPSSHSRRVLIVDDNLDAAELLGEVLRVHGHHVEIAPDGPSALRIVATFQPDLAVLDIGLPVMDGYELARKLRADFAHLAITLVALTGYGQDKDREMSSQAGFDAHLVKPLKLSDLRSFLETRHST